MIHIISIVTSSIIYCITLLFFSLNFIESRFNSIKPTFSFSLFFLFLVQGLKTFAITRYDLTLDFAVSKVILICQSIIIFMLMHYQVLTFILYYESRYRASIDYYKYLITILITFPTYLICFGSWYLLPFIQTPWIMNTSLYAPGLCLIVLTFTILLTSSNISIHYYSLLSSPGTTSSRGRRKLFIIATLGYYISTLLPLIALTNLTTIITMIFQAVDIYLLITIHSYRQIFMIKVEGRRKKPTGPRIRVSRRLFVMGSEPSSSTESLK